MHKIKMIGPCAVLLLLYAIGVKAQQKPQPANFKFMFEKVYLHTDRNTYSAGDTLWYKAYLTNAQTSELTSSSANLYVELIAPADTLVSRQTIELKGGLGNGDITLPDSLVAGTYRLRAYTNWMRNFGDAFVFEQQLLIDGISQGPKKMMAAVKSAKKSKTPLQLTVKPVNNVTPAQPLTVKFYPEGGAMVKGITGLIAVKAESNGQVADLSKVQGSVYIPSGDTVARFTCDSLGMALITLLPISGQPYQARVNYGQGTLIVPLPTALDTGLAMRVTHRDTALQVAISSSQPMPETAQQLTLTGRHSGKTCFTQQITLNNTQFVVKVPFNLLPAGVSSLTLYDSRQRPQAERLVFIHPSNKQKVSLSITPDKAVYQSKEKVNLNLKATDAAGQPVKTMLSLAVIDGDAVKPGNQNISTYLLLQSELQGNISNPAQYFDTTNVNRHKQLNLLLLTQGWRDFVWRRIADTAIRISYAAEKGFTLKGRLRQKFDNKPLVGKQVVATVIQGRADSKMYLAITDSLGRYQFDTLQVKGKRDVQLAALDGKQKSLGWLLVDSIKPAIIPINPLALKDTAVIKQDLIKSSYMTVMQQRRAMRNGNAIKLKEVVVNNRQIITSPNFFGTLYKPDKIFNITPKDHSYKTVLWYLLQNLPGAMASNNNEVTGITIRGMVSVPPGPYTMMLLKPILVVDGRQNSYQEQSAEMERKIIYDLPIESVKKIVLKHYMGTRVISGQFDMAYFMIGEIFVIELTLKPGALNTPDATKTSMEIDGYYQARTFYQPVYDAQKPNPDYRTTLHWAPNITTNAKGEAQLGFYNADPKTTVRVVAQGITSKGTPVVAVSEYVVK
jgi:hypothetical protein